MLGYFMDSAENLKIKNRITLTIDGPAGVGKTTIGQLLAARLGITYLDTGAMYRAVTWQALQNGVTLVPPDATRLVEFAHNLKFVSRNATAQEAEDGRQYTVMLDGRDVSQALRDPEVEKWVSVIAAIPQVRVELVERQREIARQMHNGIIMIGRDIGSIVLPNADFKVYLDASPEVRASRRNLQKAGPTNQQETQRDLEKRDKIDSQRAVAPLVVPEDALVIFTDNLSQEQVVECIEQAVVALIR